MKRYQLCGEENAMVLSQDGHWITFEDYEIMKSKLEAELAEPVAMITESPFMVENITIDQRYKFEQIIAKQAKVIEKLKQQRSAAISFARCLERVDDEMSEKFDKELDEIAGQG